MNYDGPSYYKQKKINKSTSNSERSDQLFNEKVPAKNKFENAQTPPPHYSVKQNFNKVETTPTKSRYFRNKYIPQSLQNLEGWKKTEQNQELLSELENRLVKMDEDYLLFGSDSEVDVTPREVQQEDKNLAAQPAAVKQTKTTKQETITKAHQQLKKDLQRPATGLHRSLSKIMAEDEAALKRGKNNLDSLFN